MSLTSTISSWPRSKVVGSTSSGSWRSPANISRVGPRHPRRGVRRPSRSGSSPTASRISRTAASIRGARRAGPTSPGPAPVTASVARASGDAGRRQRAIARRRAGRSSRRRRRPRPGAVLRRPLATLRSVGLSTGGIVDTARCSLESQTGARIRFTIGVKISASSSLLRVSRSSSATTRSSSTCAVLDEDLPGLVVRRLDQPAHLVVDHRGDVLGVVALVAHVAAEEDLARPGPSLIAPTRSLMPNWVTILRAVAVAFSMSFDGAGGGVVEDELLGDPAAHRVGELVEQLVAGGRVLVLGAASPSCSRAPGRGAGSSPW